MIDEEHMQDQPPRVVIRPDSDPGTVFPTVGVTLSQLVFWANNDKTAHFPFSPDGAFALPAEIQPGTTSNTQAPGNAIGKLAPGGKLNQGQVYKLQYKCSLHDGETGILELVNDFFPPNLQISITRNTDKSFAPVALIQGGKPPYTCKVIYSELPSTVTVADGGPSGPMLKGSSANPGTFLLRVTITDALSNIVDDESFQVTIS
jgi:hypothetical protein